MSINKTSIDEINPNIDSRIRETDFSIVLSLKNGLQGEERSDPEIYLREFINSSQYFKLLSNYEVYIAPNSEAHGECDAITSCYQIDFKTLISSSMANGKRNTSFQRKKVAPGVFYAIKAKSNRQYLCGHLMKVLRNYTLNDFEKRTYKNEDKLIVNDIDTFLNILHKDKNIILFLPSRFTIQDLKKDENPIEIMTDALTYDSLAFMEYRHKCLPDKDTFLSTIVENEFVIWKSEHKKLLFIESVPIEKSKTFMYLKQFI